MSFCGELKEELCQMNLSRCCDVAEMYGLLLFGRHFSYRGISLCTANKTICERLLWLLKTNFAVLPAVAVTGKTVKQYTVNITDPASCRLIMHAFGYAESDRLFINGDVFKKECCFGSFIRGAFLACGQMSDPYKNYHTEFIIKDLSLALEFYRLLLDRKLSPKRSMRGNTTVLYFSNSETIEEILTAMGDNAKVFELIDVQIAKSIRNGENRKSNLDMGNIGKQVEASIAQRSAIDFLLKSDKLITLPPELQSVAKLRTDNPTATLGELCRLYGEPITRSGMNHRLGRIVDRAKELGFIGK